VLHTFLYFVNLRRAHQLNRPKVNDGVLAVATSSKVTKLAAPGGAQELRDGTPITFELALKFMDLYCREFQYGAPEVSYKSFPHGSRTTWVASLTVGGGRIGSGNAPTKKRAKRNCYIDATHYVDQCDGAVWPMLKDHQFR
jgi:hypothetical protein